MKPPSPAPILRASSYQGPNSIADLTLGPAGLRWIIKNGTTKLLEAEFLNIPASPLGPGGQVFPPADPHNLLSKGVVLMPGLPGPLLSLKELTERCSRFIHSYADLPDLWVKICAHYAIHTWVYDRFSAVPYLRFLGEPQSGKTRTLQTVSQLCYKAIIGGGATSASALFRLLEDWRGTFCMDEADYGKGDLYSEIAKILNNGYQKGLYVVKSEKLGDSFSPCAFDPFGPKVITTRHPFQDIATESRCLTYYTPTGASVAARIPRQLPEAFFSEAAEIRSLLLRWRLETWQSIHGDQSELLSLAPRLTQILVPLWAVIEDKAFKRALLSHFSAESSSQRSLTASAVLIESLRRQAENLGGSKPWVLTVKDTYELSAEISSEWGAELRFSPKSTGTLLRSLGLETSRNRSGCYQFILTAEALKALEAGAQA